MGGIISRHASNALDAFVLRVARLVDSVLRTINRRLSTFSSYFFSRVFGYDVVVLDDAPPSPTSIDPSYRRGDLVCAPGGVCIVPASRIQQRELDKRRRSERRKRAEAAAMGQDILCRHKDGLKAGYAQVESMPSSPTVEEQRVKESLGEVARAPPRRPEWERETASERNRGKLWVMGNVAPSKRYEEVDPKTVPVPKPLPVISEKAMDEGVLQRMHSQRAIVGAAAPPRAIQPRKSSRLPNRNTKAEMEEKPGAIRLVAPTAVRLPVGALSLSPSPWQPAFRHPFATTPEEALLPSTIAAQALVDAKPRLSLDIPRFTSSPPPMDDDTLSDMSRPASSTSHRARTPIATGGLTRKSFDAISMRAGSFDTSAVDLKTLASKAVKEDKGRKVWKDQVNKVAMQRCLHQRHMQSTDAPRRFSTATLGGPDNRPLTRIKTHDADLRGRRGSSPALSFGQSTPMLRG